MLYDRRRRPLRDLRISVTDRCNFRCPYCMPGDREYPFLPRRELLTFEEMTAICQTAAGFGVRKLRLTGGEPLLRRDLATLIRMLAAIPGIEDIALTTNGFLLAQSVDELQDAGLRRVTISLDSLEEATFSQLSGRSVQPQRILNAIDAAAGAGLPVKINMVVQRGINDHEIIPMLTHFRGTDHIVRFIEFMDVGSLNAWRAERVVSAAEILDRIERKFPCQALEPAYHGEVARRYRFCDGGEFGLIASVSQPFCGACTRARLSADGQLFTCLFANRGHDLKTPLRGPGGRREMARVLERIWSARDDRYSELRGKTTATSRDRVEMYHIGG